MELDKKEFFKGFSKEEHICKKDKIDIFVNNLQYNGMIIECSYFENKNGFRWIIKKGQKSYYGMSSFTSAKEIKDDLFDFLFNMICDINSEQSMELRELGDACILSHIEDGMIEQLAHSKDVLNRRFDCQPDIGKRIESNIDYYKECIEEINKKIIKLEKIKESYNDNKSN